MRTRLRHSINDIELVFLSQRVIRDRLSGLSAEEVAQQTNYKPYIIRQAVRRYATPREILNIGWIDRARHMGLAGAAA